MNNLSVKIGLPDLNFISQAWAAEPLTSVLKETNIQYALPPSDHTISLLAVDKINNTIAQCSANHANTYWRHLETVNSESQNLSTCIFIAIHKKAVQAERDYLKKLGGSGIDIEPLHNSGIAVLPEFRGKDIGFEMAKQQIELLIKNKTTLLFSETTNRYSASIMERLGFHQLAQYSYKTLAVELDHADLAKINDAFTVWVFNPL